MTRTAWLVTAGVCGAGLLGGVAMRPLVLPSGQVVLHPRNVQFTEGHIEGEPLEAHFELSNESRSAINVTALSKSCGCMALTGKDGPIKTPFSLAAGESLPITLSISTAARVGPNAFALAVSAEGPRGGSLEARAAVGVNLLGALRSDRQTVIFRGVKQGERLSAEILLADMLADPGVAIREIKSTNPKSMAVELVPTSGASKIFGENVAANTRATLKLSYLPDAAEGRIQEIITIVPQDSRFPTLQIPVYCEMAEPPLRLIPSALTLSAGAGSAFRRTVVLRSDEPIAVASVVECPDGLKVEIAESSQREKQLVVEGDFSKLNQNGSEIRFAVDGLELTLPIRVLP